MNSHLIRPWRAVAATVAVAAASATAAGAAPNQYCDPLGGCNSHPSHYLSVSPGTVKAGKSTTLSGAVGHGCRTPGQVTIYSNAFKGATSHEFARVPAVYVTTNRNGKFSKKVTIKKTIRAARYHVGARCGGGSFGSATLRVSKH
jgi:hypothetical protein